MGTVINFVKAYEARRARTLCSPPPPAVFYCWTCRRVSRYYLRGGTQTCALCQVPGVRLWENPPMPGLSGAQDPAAPFWLPREIQPCDREIVAGVCEGILRAWGCGYCPVHHPVPERSGLSVTDFYRLLGAARPEDKGLAGDALQLLLERRRAYRRGRGVAGNPYRYYVCRQSCRGKERQGSGQPVSAGEIAHEMRPSRGSWGCAEVE